MKYDFRRNIMTYAIGTTVSICIVLMGTAILSWLLLKNSIGQGTVVITGKVILCLAGATGSYVVMRKQKGSRFLAAVICCCALISVMIIGGLTIDGEFSNIWNNIIAVSTGCVVSCVICRNNAYSSKKRKVRNR